MELETLVCLFQLFVGLGVEKETAVYWALAGPFRFSNSISSLRDAFTCSVVCLESVIHSQ